MGNTSRRRFVLGTVLALLVLLDISAIYHAIAWITVGGEFRALEIPNIGFASAAAQIPATVVLLWLTYVVWAALPDS